MPAFDPNALLLSMLVSGIGLVLFVYGRKELRWPHLTAGVVFMAYPYFVDSAVVMLVVGVALGVGLWVLVRMGY